MTNDMTLVERLRADYWNGWQPQSLMNEAADEIERLQAEVKAWTNSCTGKHGSQVLCRSYALEPESNPT